MAETKTNLGARTRGRIPAVAIYGASAAGSDTYAVTYTPTLTAYETGAIYTFKADVGNTGTATLNIDGLGAKSLKKYNNTDLSTDDLAAGALVVCQYDGTNMQIIGGLTQQPLSIAGTGGETLVPGDWIYRKTSDSKVYKADNSTIEKATLLGVITQGGAANDPVRYVGIGQKWTTTGLTAGSEYWLSSTPGALTATAPVMDSASVVPVKVGFASSTTELDIQIQRLQRVKSVEYSVSGVAGTTTLTVGFPISHALQQGTYDTTTVTTGTIYLKHHMTFGYYDATSATQYEYGRGSGAFLWVPASAGSSGGQGASCVASVSSNNLVITSPGSSGGAGGAIGIATIWEKL